MPRIDDRKKDELRKVKITTGFIGSAQGSCLYETGSTRVICTAMVESKVPSFLKDTGKGWITAEYNMLPGSTKYRKPRKPDGRSTEIKRLIGRSLRSAVNLDQLGEYTIWIDCDVIEADGGTRTASITGGFIALVLAVKWMIDKGKIEKSPIQSYTAAVSAGIVNDAALLDLCYAEDSNAKVDMNVVMNGAGEFMEIQGTGEESPFSIKELNEILELSKKGIDQLIDMQKEILGEACDLVGCNE